MHESTLKCWIDEKNFKGLCILASESETGEWIKQEFRALVYFITKIRVGF